MSNLIKKSSIISASLAAAALAHPGHGEQIHTHFSAGIAFVLVVGAVALVHGLVKKA